MQLGDNVRLSVTGILNFFIATLLPEEQIVFATKTWSRPIHGKGQGYPAVRMGYGEQAPGWHGKDTVCRNCRHF
jgi:hypothetical protein